MQAGDLVKTIQGQIGIPIGTLGLIIDTVPPRSNESFGEYDIMYHVIQLCGLKHPRTVRRLPRDLEIVNASR